jgi:hypothetical protein
MIVTININLSDADRASYSTLVAPDTVTFLIAKLAAQLSGAMQTTLSDGTDIIALLQPGDQASLQGLVSVVQNMPVAAIPPGSGGVASPAPATTGGA